MASEGNHANTLTLRVRDAHGRLHSVPGGRATVRSTQTLVVVNRRLPFDLLAATLPATYTSTNLCLVCTCIGAQSPRADS